MSHPAEKTNIRKLAEFIYNTGNADRIMAALEIALSAGLADDLRAMNSSNQQEGDKEV